MNITSRIQAVRIPFSIPIAPDRNLERFVYSYIVCGAERVCLIDSGVAGSVSAIQAGLAESGRSMPDVSLLLLTHSHPDHIGGAVSVRKSCQCPVAAHSAAQRWVEDVDAQFKERPVPGFHSLVEGSVGVDSILSDGDTVDLGGMSLRVIHTPGHSQCSISLFCKEEGVLFAGDAIPQGNDLPIYAEAASAVQSIRRLKAVAGVKHLLASWSDPQPDVDPYTIMDNGLAYFRRIHARVREEARKGPVTDPMALCRRMVEGLGLPAFAVNPLIAASFASHLPFIGQEEL